MKHTAVYIATTEGPSEIQRITPEDPDVRSVICHDGKAIALPVSAEYDSFVRRPTGVIEACFGHGAYRVDIGDPVASGLSWQLGLFTAHALCDEGRLVRAGDRVPQIVWATGEVTRDLSVDAVEDVDRKIRRSESLIRTHLDRGSRIVLAVPVGNLIEANRALADVFAEDCDRLHVVPAPTVCDVLAALGLRRRRRTRQWLARTPSAMGSRRQMPRRLVHGVSLALVAITVATGWQKIRPSADPALARAQAVRAVPVSMASLHTPALAIDSVTVRPPEGLPCAAVHLGRVAPGIARHAVAAAAPAAGLRVVDLCDFRYRLTNRSGRPAIVWVMAQRAALSGDGFRVRPFHAEKSVAANHSLELDARPPHALAVPLRQTFFILSAPAVSRADLDGIRASWRRALKAASGHEVRKNLAGAQAHGAALHVLTNDFRP